MSRRTTSVSEAAPARWSGERHAVVVGGSIGGMLAARVLADQFDRVTVVERDHLPPGLEERPGVPQARHLHFLMRRGLSIFEQLFPGVTADLVDAGSHMIDQGKDFRILYRYGWSPHVSCDLSLCTFTRPLLEVTVRRHLFQNPKVRFLAGFEVSGLLADGDGSAVTGVRLRPRGAPAAGAEEQTLHAELVVDTSGRGSRAPEWLAELGHEALEETVVDAFWGYATRVYEPVPGFEKEWKSLLLMNRPPHQPRAGIIQPIEGNRWLVTVAGVMSDYPPADEEGFLAFARSLSSPELYEAIRDARPLSKVSVYRRTENRLRHYDRLPMPEGFVAMGDAVCSFNPVYGVGMTVTALEALELGRAVGEHRRRGTGRLNAPQSGMARSFQKRVAGICASSWALTTGEDLRWPATKGGRITAKVRLMHWYIDHVIRLIPENVQVFRRFQRVNHMVAPPESLFHPAVLFPVLRQAATLWLTGHREEAGSWIADAEEVAG